VAVVATLTKGYDLEYIWKQVDRGAVKDAASYYIQASESGGEPPGRWWGPGAKALGFEPGQRIDREQILRKLVEIQYERNDADFNRGAFRVRGDIVEVYPSYEDIALRIELFGDEIDGLISFDPLTGKTIRRHDKVAIFPKTHFVAPRDRTRRAVENFVSYYDY